MNKFILIICLGALTSCMKDEDPVKIPRPISNDEEVITTVELVFRDSATNSILFRYGFRDNDGPGGNAPVTDTVKLPANDRFYVETLFLNASTADADTISNEIREEGDEHLVAYSTSIAGLTITTSDKDNNNLPLGLMTSWQTMNASSGTIRIRLLHQPDGIKNGSDGPGETEVDIQLPVRIY